MADFQVLVRQISEPVVDHPNAGRLTIVTIDGYQCIANKHEDGSWRYNQGDHVVYIPENAIVPEWLLQRLDMWDEGIGRGMLAGAAGNRVKAIKLRGVVSQGILYSVPKTHTYLGLSCQYTTETVKVLQDVADLLGITKYEPPVPSHMTGEIRSNPAYVFRYDFDSIQSHPRIFDEGEPVFVTEKLHGTFCNICFTSESNPELFGTKQNIYVASKGLGAKGLVFKNNSANDTNLYVRILRKLLDEGLEEKAASIVSSSGKIHILGEILGPGAQDMQYGLKEPVFRVFDITTNDAFLLPNWLRSTCDNLDLTPVPHLYEGPFDRELLQTFRDGKTTFGEAHIREGIVIKSATEARHPRYGRKIAKWVSPDYLLRKNKSATEYQ